MTVIGTHRFAFAVERCADSPSNIHIPLEFFHPWDRRIALGLCLSLNCTHTSSQTPKPRGVILEELPDRDRFPIPQGKGENVITVMVDTVPNNIVPPPRLPHCLVQKPGHR
jgi:hypothetical protein